MNHQLSETELAGYTKGQSLIDRLQALHKHQVDNWSLANENYTNLDSVKIEKLEVDGFEIHLQHNPHRAVSTMADVSEKTVSKRKCILCEENLPNEQKLIRYYKEYNFLINPFPIFNEHFTIAKSKHIQQGVSTYFNDLLLLTRDVGERYVVFYNGAKCGASIPEHLHFQMGNKEQLPLFDYLNNPDKLSSGNSIVVKKVSIYSLTEASLSGFILQSKDTIELLNIFSVLNLILQKISSSDIEPMFNILVFYEKPTWSVVIFLRQKHRPDCYYKKDDSQIVVSPAALDLGGLLIVPRTEDLEKLTEETIKKIFREVSLAKEVYEYTWMQLNRFLS